MLSGLRLSFDARKALLALAIVATTTGLGEADQILWCPNASTQCVVTGTGCVGVQVIWEEGICGCQPDDFFTILCTTQGMTGSVSCEGSTTNDCKVNSCQPEVDWEHGCDVPNPEMSKPPPPPDQVEEPPPTCGGHPVIFATGAMFFTHVDAVVGDLVVSRTFNTASMAAGRYGVFGTGWNATFDERLNVVTAKTLEGRLPDGTAQYYFDANADGVFEAILPYSKESQVQAVTGGYTQTFRRGGLASYDTTGKLLAVTYPAGVVTTYSRDTQGRLTSFTRLGRTISIGYSGSSSQPSQLSSGGTVLAVYTYNVTGLLDAVSCPGGGGYHYQYANGRVISVTDASGRMVEAHEYDTQGRALTSEIGNGVEKLSFSYGTNQTTVTDAAGNVTTYDYVNVRGTRRVTKATGPCTSCGGSGGDVQSGRTTNSGTSPPTRTRWARSGPTPITAATTS